MSATVTISAAPVDVLRDLPVGTHTLGPISIAANGVVRGQHPMQSVLQANAASNAVGGLIRSTNWLAGGSSFAQVRDLKLLGNQGIPIFPYGDTAEKALTTPVSDAIDIDGYRTVVQNVKIHDFRGYGIRYNNSDVALGGAGNATFPLIQNNNISHCWTGILGDYIDSQVYGNVVVDVRDYGFWERQGALQSANNHFYGAQIAMLWGLLDFAPIGPNKSNNDTCSDAHVGFYNTSANGSTVWDMFSQHCWSNNLRTVATTDFYNPHVRMVRTTTTQWNQSDYDGSTALTKRIVGIKLIGLNSRVLGGTVYLNDYQYPGTTLDATFDGGIGIQMDHGFQTVKDTRIIFSAPITSPSFVDKPNQWGVYVSGGAAATQRQYKTIDVELQNFGATSMQSLTNLWGVYVADGALDQGYNLINIKGFPVPGTDFDTAGDRRLRLPTNWNVGGVAASNRAYINGQEITANVYPPP